jgi:carbonic anhydrase/acetyltransferase-like protein (isoleucine patch superfamily)
LLSSARYTKIDFEMFCDPLPHLEKVHPTAFIAPNAVVVGDVTVGADASVWFGAVVRGDVEAVVIGPQTNIQDGAVLHADTGKPCRLGARVTLGHGAIVHGAIVDDDVLIGIRATVLNGAHIGRDSVIAAGALVPPGMVVPPESVVMGVPGKVVRRVSAADQTLIRNATEHYVDYARIYRQAYKSSQL